MDKKIGLTLGKFAPLHKGHQYMIETAIKEMNEVIVIIYDCPETTSIPLPIRAGWIRKLYPNIKVIEAWDGPVEIGYTPEIKRMHEEYILNILNGQKITHFYSSEPYGEHMSKALGAVNRTVDSNRETYPISATKIREDAFSNREYIDDFVYKDLITNVVFLGAPSTGKTTIAESLAERYDTVWMTEYGREYWDLNNVERRLTPEQLAEIAKGHIEREDKLMLKANRYLFTDTNAITTYMFSQYYHGFADDKLIELANAAASRYDLVFVCADDIPYDDTWDRSGEVQRSIFQKQIIADLTLRRIPYILLDGSLKERICRVKNILSAYSKYQNLGNMIQCGLINKKFFEKNLKK